jgi:branched-chain amino acid transport system ATP-binding protein
VSTANGSPPALEVLGLNAFYRKSQVVFDLDLSIERGETVTILGRNGAGKTTMLMALAGVVTSRAKMILLDGHDISRLPSFRRVRHGLALVPSGSRSFPNLTVQENLDIVRTGSAKGFSWTIDDVYDAFPVLEALKDASGGTLSGGERQMLAVARALVSGPRVLMLDEPSEGLAPLVLRDITAWVRELNERGLSVLLAEQSHRFALETAHRALFVEKGRIVWKGTAADAGRPEILGRYLSV